MSDLELPRHIEEALQEITDDLAVLVSQLAGKSEEDAVLYFLHKYGRIIEMRNALEKDLLTLQSFVPRDNRRVKEEFSRVIASARDLGKMRTFKDFKKYKEEGAYAG